MQTKGLMIAFNQTIHSQRRMTLKNGDHTISEFKTNSNVNNADTFQILGIWLALFFISPTSQPGINML